ncbi:Hypothetical protein PBC10988_26440 [Planctomycetales bacterium 10988]|nr:Hypothetical protein PBC10988_26440 [Planctomycetales bacterium 10988]
MNENMEDQEDDGKDWQVEFLQAIGESFYYNLDDLVTEEDLYYADPDDWLEPVLLVMGNKVTPTDLALITESQILAISKEFGEGFECPPVSIEKIKQAVADTLARWSPGDLGEDTSRLDQKK